MLSQVKHIILTAINIPDLHESICDRKILSYDCKSIYINLEHLPPAVR